MPNNRSAAPIIAGILLLAILYVGSYLALVVPEGHMVIGNVTSRGAIATPEHYRFGSQFFSIFFLPIEQLDRRMRPGAWVGDLSHYGSGATYQEIPDLSP
ncbi:hypothetical protein ETAA8_63900 [Anatilimnocola aggregata]|uniref:Uncharacterized protein n=1 Tax=Anatilimnocola aggregata TaxID=2528021 RepID=A0A517YLY6_9BACT|nr:hypothetical protein [Anatilimnocola aggregata]QDU31237.1 hypothetical protein ETAA8_63900 [Anatilimnocola aggregata]